MKIKLLSFITSLIIRIFYLTCRYRIYFKSQEDKEFFINAMSSSIPDKTKAYILAFFHQDELSLIPYFRNVAMGILVSVSKDGELMNQTAQRLGYITARGSSSKKAVSGLISSIKKVRQGYKFSFAVDGPRGPIYKVKEGAIAVSNKTDTPIFPVKAFPHSFKLFEKSWNQAKLPIPFTTIDIIFGKLGRYNRDDLEKEMLSIEHDTSKYLSL